MCNGAVSCSGAPCPRKLLTSVAAVVFLWLLFVTRSNTVVLLAAVSNCDGCSGAVRIKRVSGVTTSYEYCTSECHKH
jgi:hypothetical protein